MKLKKIHIKKWHQFEDLELDLTYPKDYREEKLCGQPLKKVCFIGPNGTGKSKILNLIFNNPEKFFSDEKEILEQIELNFLHENGETKEDEFKKTFLVTNFTSSDVKIYARDLVENMNYESINYNLLQYTGIRLIDLNLARSFVYLVNALYQKHIFDFSVIVSKRDFTKLEEEQVKTVRNIFQEGLSNFQPSLKYDDINKSIGSIVFDLHGQKIDLNSLSSGIKDNLVKFFYLKWQKLQNAIIMLDEPENSLFPDVQKNLVNFGTVT